MVRRHISSCIITLSMLGLLIGCAERSPQELIERNDHAGLVQYYTEEAQKFRQKAHEWERKAEFYEARYRRTPSNPNVHEPVAFERHAAHCRMIAQNTEEAEALAGEHPITWAA